MRHWLKFQSTRPRGARPDLAQVLSLSTRTVFVKFIRSGVIPSRKFGARSYRVRPVDFNEWVARGNTGFRHVAPK